MKSKSKVVELSHKRKLRYRKISNHLVIAEPNLDTE